MANLEEMAAAFRNEGYSEINSEAILIFSKITA